MGKWVISGNEGTTEEGVVFFFFFFMFVCLVYSASES